MRQQSRYNLILRFTLCDSSFLIKLWLTTCKTTLSNGDSDGLDFFFNVCVAVGMPYCVCWHQHRRAGQGGASCAAVVAGRDDATNACRRRSLSFLRRVRRGLKNVWGERSGAANAAANGFISAVEGKFSVIF